MWKTVLIEWEIFKWNFSIEQLRNWCHNQKRLTESVKMWQYPFPYCWAGELINCSTTELAICLFGKLLTCWDTELPLLICWDAELLSWRCWAWATELLRCWAAEMLNCLALQLIFPVRTQWYVCKSLSFSYCWSAELLIRRDFELPICWVAELPI